MHEEIGFGFDDLNPVKHVKKAVGGIGRSIRRATKDPSEFLKLLPAATTALTAPGRLVAHGAKALGAGETITTALDPAGHLASGFAKGARAGLKAGGAAGFFKGGLKGATKAGHDITKNPIIKATAAGLTFVIPPAGLALSGGLVAMEKGLAAAKQVQTGIKVAEKLVGAMEHGTPNVKKAVAQVYARTTSAAKAGDPDAKRALLVLSAAKTKLDAMRSHTYLVAPNGQISRGKFAKVATGTAGARVGFYVRADGHVERGAFKAA